MTIVITRVLLFLFLFCFFKQCHTHRFYVMFNFQFSAPIKMFSWSKKLRFWIDSTDHAVCLHAILAIVVHVHSIRQWPISIIFDITNWDIILSIVVNKVELVYRDRKPSCIQILQVITLHHIFINFLPPLFETFNWLSTDNQVILGLCLSHHVTSCHLCFCWW